MLRFHVKGSGDPAERESSNITPSAHARVYIYINTLYIQYMILYNSGSLGYFCSLCSRRGMKEGIAHFFVACPTTVIIAVMSWFWPTEMDHDLNRIVFLTAQYII